MGSNKEATPTPKRKRKSRWSDAPSTSEDQKIAVAMSSFSQPVGTQISAEQQQQLLEQQEVGIYINALYCTIYTMLTMQCIICIQ